jgi:hypothetical protein
VPALAYEPTGWGIRQTDGAYLQIPFENTLYGTKFEIIVIMENDLSQTNTVLFEYEAVNYELIY